MLTSRDKNLAILDLGHRTPCRDRSKAKGRPRVGRRHEGHGASTPPPPVLWNVCNQRGKQAMTLLVPSDAETEIQRGKVTCSGSHNLELLARNRELFSLYYKAAPNSAST